MSCTKNLQQYDFDALDPWIELMSFVAWSFHSTHHSTLKASPVKLVYNREMILKDIKFVNDCKTIRLGK